VRFDAERRAPLLAVGAMSGTSLDGVTVALVRIEEPAPDDIRVALLAHRTQSYSATQQARLAAAVAGGTPRDLTLLDADLGGWFADAVEGLLREEAVGVVAMRSDAGRNAAGSGTPSLAFVASHGQTIWHEPRRATLQLGDPAVLAERLGVPIVADFRSRDVAAGGEGAPLVPRADRLLFSRPDGPRALLNLGGIANFTVVPPRGDPAPLLAFDTGPGVMVVDACVRRLFPGRRFDEDGAIARSGRVLEPVVTASLAHPFFHADPPKSTGREQFGEAFAEGLLARCLEAGGAPADAVATAVELTARAVALGARLIPPALAPLDVVRSGGGARNPALVAAIERCWPGVAHRAFDDLFFDGEAKEAVAFALLGYLTWTGRPGNEPGATGATGPRVLGSVTPP
jgi:anhydro-N-acetylmuramic acid kinase